MSVLDLLGKGPRFHEWHKGQCQTCGLFTDDGKLCVRPYLGHTVANARTPHAVIRFGSVTTLSRADNTREGSCLRKWAFEKVHGIRPPEKVWQTAGKDLHKEIKEYLRSGVNALSRLALSGKHLLPEPGDDLDTEREISGIPQLSKPVLFLAGVPFIGGYDLRHTRGTHRGDDDTVKDPDGTCEVIDFKSGKTLDWSLTSEALARDHQMVGYGEVARLEIPALRYIRLTHINFITGKTAPGTARSILLPAERIAETWESFTPVMQSMQSAARETNPDDVPANPGQACTSYGGCPHAQYCSSGNPLALMYASLDKEETKMGILDKVIKPAVDMSAQVAALAAAEAAKRLPVLPDGFIEACKIIDAAGLGWPPVSGELARGVAMYRGFPPKADCAYPGVGTLGGLESQTDYNVILELAQGLCDRALNDDGTGGPMFPGLRERALNVPAAVLPSDAPKSDPVATLAAMAKPQPVAPVAEAPVAEAFIDPKGRGAVTASAVEETPAAPAKRRGRPAGSKNKARTATDTATPGDTTEGFSLFVDCMEHPDSDSLHTSVDALVSQILQHFAKDEPNGVPAIDLRCATSKALEYGKWKAVLAGCVVEAVREGKVPPGNYTLYTLGDEVAQVAANALRSVADLYVRGS